MPKYHNLPILTELGKVVTLKQSKEKTSKPLPEEQGRKAVEVLLKKYSKLGVDNSKMRLDYVKKSHESCKKTLASMEKLRDELEDPDYIPEIYKLPECKAGLTIIQTHADAVSKDAKTMYALMGEYRANWTATIAKICKDTSFVDKYIAIRTKTMTLGKQAVGLADRLDEYVKRAEMAVARAEKARKREEQGNKEIMAEADKLLKDIETAESEAAEVVKKGATLIKRIEGAKTMKPYTGKEHRLVESQIEDIKTNRKGIAGKVKTSESNSKELDKLIQKKSFLLTNHKKKRDTAIEKLQEHLKTVEADLAKAEKIYASLEKSLFAKK